MISIKSLVLLKLNLWLLYFTFQVNKSLLHLTLKIIWWSKDTLYNKCSVYVINICCIVYCAVTSNHVSDLTQIVFWELWESVGLILMVTCEQCGGVGGTFSIVDIPC